MKKSLFLFLSIIFIFTVQSCVEEGCTDENALNYNEIAKEDDGSCVYCRDTETDTIFFRRDTIIENRFGTSLFEDSVITMRILQTQSFNPISNCPDSTDACRLQLFFRNNTEFEMVNFAFNINVFGPISENYFVSDVNLSPDQDSLLVVDNNLFFDPLFCPSLEQSSISVSISSGIYLP